MNAILVFGIRSNNEDTYQYYIDELKSLAESLNIETIATITQKINKVNSQFFIGPGKVEELRNLILTLNADIVIFDDELSPSQLQNLKDKLLIEVIDRSLLILNIFESRAKTAESIIEIKIAKLKYLLPRLIGNNNLSRQGGSSSVSSKGAGETQLELDRRKIYNEIEMLEKRLLEIRKNRSTQRIKRNKSNIPIVSLVGYTNAGKSTTLNKILSVCAKSETKKVLEKDMLFATLDTSVRAICLKNNQKILLIDTVGFVSKLPTLLINSFRSTLEEILYSSLIIHVVDISNKYYLKQIEITEKILKELGADEIPTFYLLNKADKVQKPLVLLKKDYLLYSNKDDSINLLLSYIEKRLIEHNIPLDLMIPFSNGKAIAFIDAECIVKAKIITNNGIYYKLYAPKHILKALLPYQVKDAD